jgi:hypothetical protein
MNIAIYASGEKARENMLVDAIRAGGVRVDVLRDVDPHAGVDLHCVIGLKCLEQRRALDAVGIPYLYFDKGYNRDWPSWWRVSYCSQQPTAYLMDLNAPPDRAEAQGWMSRLAPWRVAGKHVLYAGSSAKYSAWMDLPDPTVMAEQTVRAIQSITGRRVTYRPKPSWRGAVPVDGASWSRRGEGGPDIHRDLRGAHVLVTHGSSCCFDALMAGVPSIVLGGGVLAPISSRSLDEVERPCAAHQDERLQLLANLAYCQWSLQEFRRGEPWQYIDFLIQNSTLWRTGVIKSGSQAR